MNLIWVVDTGRNPYNFAYLRSARELVPRTTRFRFDDIHYHVPLLAQVC
jgi:hypothetical protein